VDGIADLLRKAKGLFGIFAVNSFFIPFFKDRTMVSPTGNVITGVDMPKGSATTAAIGCDCCARFKMAGSKTAGPHPTGKNFGFDGALVDHFIKNNIQTTFFLTGKWMRDHPAETRKLMQAKGKDGNALFEIGNHGWGHQSIRLLSEAGKMQTLDKEVSATENQYNIYRAELKGKGIETPPMARVFRPPYGDFDKASVERIQGKHDYQVINWSDAIDAEKVPKSRVGDKPVKSGSIYLMHIPSGVDGTGTNKGNIAQMDSLKGVRFKKISDIIATPGAGLRFTDQPEKENRDVGTKIGGKFLKAMAEESNYFPSGSGSASVSKSAPKPPAAPAAPPAADIPPPPVKRPKLSPVV
jgi:peptidoglycan/xylan/chitin deacetylase (PgdA/CDA1 family)